MLRGKEAAALLGAACFTCITVYYVHHSQTADRERMRDGVRMDIERQRQRLENKKELERQIELQKKLEERDKLRP